MRQHARPIIQRGKQTRLFLVYYFRLGVLDLGPYQVDDRPYGFLLC